MADVVALRREVESEAVLAEYRATCLVLVPGLGFDEWAHEWNKLDQMGRSINWLVGDALVFAEANFPDRWTQVVDEKYIHQQKGALWVASRIPPAERRESLSWSAHREVAGLEPTERNEVLDLAQRSLWGSREVAEEVARRHPERRRAPKTQDEVRSTVEPARLHAGIPGVEPAAEPIETPEEAIAVLDALVVNAALPEAAVAAIGVVLAEREKLLRLRSVAQATVEQYALPELAAAVEAAR